MRPREIAGAVAFGGVAFASAFFYAELRGIPKAIAVAALPAFLLELTLYLLTSSKRFRSWHQRLGPLRAAVAITASTAFTYPLFALNFGRFELLPAGAVVALAAVPAFWFVLLRRRTATDLAFMLLMAAPVLLKLFDRIYPDVERIPAQFLGLLMWYRIGILSVLCIRKFEGIDFGFLPRRKDWRIGITNFGLILATAGPIAYFTGFAGAPAGLSTRTLGVAAVTFIGFLLVVAAVEEFFFRGLLQQSLSTLWGERAGLIVTSILFGLVHLPFREFPNWRFALLATVAGFFYGRAYNAARSIRAAMVAHALTVTVWRVFLA